MIMRERLKILREFWGLSQRDMARKIGVTGGAWQHYENGSNVPGGQVLASLGRLGVNLNWLLLGVGEMFRADMGDAAEMPTIPPEEYRRMQNLVKRLGLSDLLSTSELSLYGDQLVVLESLAIRRPQALTVEELEALCTLSGDSLERSSIRHILRTLELKGLIERSPERTEAYRATGKQASLVFRDITGHADLCLRSVGTLIQDVLPRATPPDGVIMNLRFTIGEEQGKSLIYELREWLRKRCTEANQDGAPDEVVVLLGAAHVRKQQ